MKNCKIHDCAAKIRDSITEGFNSTKFKILEQICHFMSKSPDFLLSNSITHYETKDLYQDLGKIGKIGKLGKFFFLFFLVFRRNFLRRNFLLYFSAECWFNCWFCTCQGCSWCLSTLMWTAARRCCFCWRGTGARIPGRTPASARDSSLEHSQMAAGAGWMLGSRRTPALLDNRSWSGWGCWEMLLGTGWGGILEEPEHNQKCHPGRRALRVDRIKIK